MNIEEKVQSLLDAANEATGGSDTNLTDAVGSLIAGQGPVYPDEYVTDGLLAQYDAIRNTRAGHDANAQGWEDLSGNGYDLSLTLGNMPIIGDNFYYFSGGRLSTESFPTDSDSNKPMYAEFVFQIANGHNSSGLIIGRKSTGNGCAHARNTTVDIQLPNTCRRTNISSDTIYCTSVMVQPAAIFMDGKFYEHYALASGGWGSAKALSFGAYTGLTQYVFYGYLCAVRFYTRNLTDEERAQNYAYDRKRFGSIAFSLETLFAALPELPSGTHKTVTVSAAQLAAASEETIAIATGKGWTVA